MYARREGIYAFGLGSETFDDRPEVRYDPEAVTVPDDQDEPSGSDAVTAADPNATDELDAWLERAIRDDSDAAVTELRERIDGFNRQFDTYVDRYETLRSLAAESRTMRATATPRSGPSVRPVGAVGIQFSIHPESGLRRNARYHTY